MTTSKIPIFRARWNRRGGRGSAGGHGLRDGFAPSGRHVDGPYRRRTGVPSRGNALWAFGVSGRAHPAGREPIRQIGRLRGSCAGRSGAGRRRPGFAAPLRALSDELWGDDASLPRRAGPGASPGRAALSLPPSPPADDPRGNMGGRRVFGGERGEPDRAGQPPLGA